MAYDKLTIYESDRDGANKITRVTSAVANGFMIDNSTGNVTVVIDNQSGNPFIVEVAHKVGLESIVDEMGIDAKVPATLADGEMYEIGPFNNTYYGNDDPDGTGIPDGKAVLFNITSGDAADVWARKPGTT